MTQQKRRIPLDEIIVPPEAAEPGANAAAEREALLGLSQVLATSPDVAVQRLIECAMKLTGADSAGISLEDRDGSEEVFRWIATTGKFARHVNGTMPRSFSPCGATVHQRSALVMRDPGRHYEYVNKIEPLICSALLVPYGRGGKLVGTVWVLAHGADKSFTTEDVRTVQMLTTFATSILDAIQVNAGKQGAASV